ncbi:MAG: hypothetical protein VX737_00400 [Pseudomonadota bacterium]|nr:hypothetical protein [Pseudomonadota bacterium]
MKAAKVEGTSGVSCHEYCGVLRGKGAKLANTYWQNGVCTDQGKALRSQYIERKIGVPM